MAVHMATIAVWLNIDGRGVGAVLEEAGKKLDGSEGEVIVDFGSVGRIDLGALRAMEGFASLADGKAVKVVLRGVNVDVYKVLKLVKLAPRFSFASGDDDHGAMKLEDRHAEPSPE
jgi:anti-anti-sigma regulatory factor